MAWPGAWADGDNLTPASLNSASPTTIGATNLIASYLSASNVSTSNLTAATIGTSGVGAVQALSLDSSGISSYVTCKIHTVTSDMSFVGVSACFGNGTKTDTPIKIGAAQTAGFYYSGSEIRVAVDNVDHSAFDIQGGVPVLQIGDGTVATSRIEITSADATGSDQLYFGYSSAATHALVAFGTADNDLEFTIVNPSSTSIIAKMTHGSGASGSGFWVYDTAGNAIAEVQVCAADTGGSGFRALVLPN